MWEYCFLYFTPSYDNANIANCLEVICTNHVQRNFLKVNYLYFQYIYQKLHFCPVLLPVCSLKENHIYGTYKIVILVYLYNESADSNIHNMKYDSGFKPKKNDSWKLMYCFSIIVIMYFEILYSLNLIFDFAILSTSL